VVSSVLKNNTLIETSEDVSGVLGLCAVLVKDQKEVGGGSARGRSGIDIRVARMVHLFKSDDLATQFEVSERSSDERG
jgi:vacuolar protein sorting-associated protein 35